MKRTGQAYRMGGLGHQAGLDHSQVQRVQRPCERLTCCNKGGVRKLRLLRRSLFAFGAILRTFFDTGRSTGKAPQIMQLGSADDPLTNNLHRLQQGGIYRECPFHPNVVGDATDRECTSDATIPPTNDYALESLRPFSFTFSNAKVHFDSIPRDELLYLGVWCDRDECACIHDGLVPSKCPLTGLFYKHMPSQTSGSALT